MFARAVLGSWAQKTAVPDTWTIPTIGITDDGDGSVTIVIGNNAGQTSLIVYMIDGGTAWTTHGTTQTGNGTVSDLTGLTYNTWYLFFAVPYDSITGGLGPASLMARVWIQDPTGAETISEQEEQIAAAIPVGFEFLAKTISYTAYGEAAVGIQAIVIREAEALVEDPDTGELVETASFIAEKTDVVAPDRRDTFTWGGRIWAVIDFGFAGAGYIRCNCRIHKRIRRGPSSHQES